MIELSPDNAAAYLLARGWLDQTPLRVEPLGWGVSNAVLRVVTATGSHVLKQARPQLRTREVWFANLDRVYREADAMRLLQPVLPIGVVPRVLFEDRENYAFLMSHAPDDAVVWKEHLLAGEARAAIAQHAGAVLGMIHEHTADRPDLVESFGDRTVFEQLRVDPFYVRVRERRPEVSAAVGPLIRALRDRSDALCHGDYSPKNLLVHSSPPAGDFTLVDYETAHLGDPTMDLGFFLSHLVLKAIFHLPRRDGFLALTRHFWDGYASIVRFRPLAELEARAIPHFAVCLLARVDGTSPVDYLTKGWQQLAVRRIGELVLLARPQTWVEVLQMIEVELHNVAPQENRK